MHRRAIAGGKAVDSWQHEDPVRGLSAWTRYDHWALLWMQHFRVDDISTSTQPPTFKMHSLGRFAAIYMDRFGGAAKTKAA
ncbi:MAG: hypothetical protein ABMA00_17775 [Gemmatimonas sp.]